MDSCDLLSTVVQNQTIIAGFPNKQGMLLSFPKSLLHCTMTMREVTNLEMMCRGVHLPTPIMITSVRLLPRMSSHMLRQVTLSNKSLLAAVLLTSERVSCVTSSMSLQPVRRGELLDTPINTAVVNLLGCCLDMQKEKS